MACSHRKAKSYLKPCLALTRLHVIHSRRNLLLIFKGQRHLRLDGNRLVLPERWSALNLIGTQLIEFGDSEDLNIAVGLSIQSF
jgi:hypothetical protein